MATNFICEHTAEFILVPYMKSLLEDRFEFVLPMFPCLTREFTNESRRLHKNCEFRLLILFPRRPEISDDQHLYVTINEELRSFKSIGDRYGVPVIAGCPKATDFWTLATCTEQVWIDIEACGEENLLSIEGCNSYRKTDADVLRIARESNIQTMDSFKALIRETRQLQPYRRWGACYKPVYFVMNGDN